MEIMQSFILMQHLEKGLNREEGGVAQVALSILVECGTLVLYSLQEITWCMSVAEKFIQEHLSPTFYSLEKWHTKLKV